MLKIKKEEESNLSGAVWKEYVLGLLMRHKKKTYTYRGFVKSLGVKSAGGKVRLSEVLALLKEEDRIEEVSRGVYRYKRKGRYVTGVVELTRSGSAYVQSRDVEKKIFVPFERLKHALNGDTVKVLVYSDDELTGEVVEILRKKKSLFVGIIYCRTDFAFLIPTGKQIPYDVYIPAHAIGEAKTGDKVLVEIVTWPEKRKNPEGKVLEVLGRPGNSRVEMNAIMAEFDLPLGFPPKVVKAAEKIGAEIPEEEYARRRDFRDVVTFTIDPEDARDFDDALSFRFLKEGGYEVGIHIADVSFYVKPATLLDREAYLRAHSVYLADRTIPMLPERLSNYICSLLPHEDRLCFSVVVTMEATGRIREVWFGRTIIRSDSRFTYEEVQRIIEGEESNYAREIRVLDHLAEKWREERKKKGALCFNQPEVYFELNEQGKPLKVCLKEMKRAHRLVEEWMLLTNRLVAEKINRDRKGRAVFIYRTHEAPTVDRIHIFRRFINKLGLEIRPQASARLSGMFQKLMQQVSSAPVRSMLESLLVRTMAKAVYSVENIGHYGLAFDYYTHFTSPIRRYPDLVVHRLLTRYLEGKRSVSKEKYWEICRHVSEMEVIAENAERASVRYKQLEYLTLHPEKVMKGKVTEVAKWGFYVEVEEIRCEGLVSVLHMKDDYYEFDEKKYQIVGRHFKRSFHLGDVVMVKTLKVDLTSRFLDFVLAGEAEGWKQLDEKDLPVKPKCKKRKGRKKCRMK